MYSTWAIKIALRCFTYTVNDLVIETWSTNKRETEWAYLVMGMTNHPVRKIRNLKLSRAIGSPSFLHVICGVGMPLARHGRVNLLFSVTMNSCFCSSIVGGTDNDNNYIYIERLTLTYSSLVCGLRWRLASSGCIRPQRTRTE